MKIAVSTKVSLRRMWPVWVPGTVVMAQSVSCPDGAKGVPEPGLVWFCQVQLFRFFCVVYYYAPAPQGGGGIKRSSASVVRLSVCLMSRTSALTRKPKGLGRRNFAQWYPRSHATPTPTSRSKGQKSKSRGGGILWRPPSRTACFSQPSKFVQTTLTSNWPTRPHPMMHFVEEYISTKTRLHEGPL